MTEIALFLLILAALLMTLALAKWGLRAKKRDARWLFGYILCFGWMPLLFYILLNLSVAGICSAPALALLFIPAPALYILSKKAKSRHIRYCAHRILFSIFLIKDIVTFSPSTRF